MFRPIRSASFVLCAAMFAASPAFAVTWPSVAQLAAHPSKADILGIHTGMPADQALKLLKAYNPKMRIAPFTGTFELIPNMKVTVVTNAGEKLQNNGEVDTNSHESFSLLTTPAPSKPVVFGIVRWINYQSDMAHSPLAAPLLANLKKKYGNPTRQDQYTMDWYYDADGNPYPEPPGPEVCGLELDPATDGRVSRPDDFSSIISIGDQADRFTGNPAAYENASKSKICGYTTRVHLTYGADDQGRLINVTMSLLNFHLGQAALQATRDALMRAQAAKDAQAHKNAASQSGPQL